MLGIHPHQAGGSRGGPDRRARASCSTHRRGGRGGRDGLDYFRDYAPRDTPADALRGAARRSPRARQAGRHPHPRRGRRHGSPCSPASTAPSSCTASPRRRCSTPALERGYYVSFAGNVTYPKADDLRSARRARARRAASSPRPTARTSLRSPPRGGRTSPRTSSTPSRRWPRRAARAPTSSAAQIDANASAAFGSVTLPTPKKELGQHFLVDENILGVIGRLAELDPDDVVLEIGPGLGVLTRYLAERVSPASTPSSSTARSSHTSARGCGERSNVEVALGDALRLDLVGTRPAAGQARREPAVQRRHAARRREPRRPAERSSCGA